jgi:hypothetical protein
MILGAHTAGASERMLGIVPSDGSTMFAKRFSVAAGTMIAGAQFRNNDARTVFPEVALVSGVSTAIAEGQVVARVRNVSEAAGGMVNVLWDEPFRTVQGGDYFLLVHIPAGSGKQGSGNGPGLGALDTADPGNCFIAGGTNGELAAIRADLEMNLVTTGVGKAGLTPSQQTPFQTFLGGGPNPAAAATATVQFGVDRGMRVRLEIFNIAGQRVRLLADGAMEAGTYTREWNGRDEQGRKVAAGVYIVKFEAGNKTITQKMVLAK